MSCTDRISEELRSKGYRITPQRLAVLQALHAGGHLSPTLVFERTSRVLPGLTETTVYRTLEFLAENGALLSTHSASGHVTYELAERDHHHMVCQVCGVEVALDHSQVHPFYAQVEAQTGFRLTGGHLTLSGLCARCKDSPTHAKGEK
jgi:Fur family ferric uptake transcriptional regulator